jgi:hypothetical protein
MPTRFPHRLNGSLYRKAIVKRRINVTIQFPSKTAINKTPHHGGQAVSLAF